MLLNVLCLFSEKMLCKLGQADMTVTTFLLVNYLTINHIHRALLKAKCKTFSRLCSFI